MAGLGVTALPDEPPLEHGVDAFHHIFSRSIGLPLSPPPALPPKTIAKLKYRIPKTLSIGSSSTRAEAESGANDEDKGGYQTRSKRKPSKRSL